MFPIKDQNPSRTFPFINGLIIIANIFIFIFEIRLDDASLQRLIYVFGLVPREVSLILTSDTKPETFAPMMGFITNIFLHGGWLHLIGNMWILYIFGDNIEDQMGHFNYLIFYLLCGAIASFTHYLLNMDSPVPAIGASGAISAVMGAYLFLFPKARIISFIPIFIIIPLFIPIPAFIYLGIWFIGQFLSGIADVAPGNSSHGIAFWAHIGGFVSGALIYPFFLAKSQKNKSKLRY